MDSTNQQQQQQQPKKKAKAAPEIAGMAIASEAVITGQTEVIVQPSSFFLHYLLDAAVGNPAPIITPSIIVEVQIHTRKSALELTEDC